ncbi:MAG: ABC transporter substrate-binding protein [Candidatus Gottesmanbacteria bacterium]
MSLLRRGRFLFWAVRELSKKYTRSLFIGIILGFSIMLFLWKIFPLIKTSQLSVVRRIGYVGEYSPSTLPLDIQKHISFGLTTVATDGAAIKGLATSWESTNSGTLYTFHLDPSIVWHTGKSVIASDINYNINNVTFTALDDQTLQVQLPNPFSVFPVLVSKPIFSKNLIGFGQYKVSTLRLKGDKITFLRLVAAKNHALPTLEYRFYRSEAQALLAYKLGEIEELSDISNIDPSMENWKNSHLLKTYNKNRIITLYFNMKDALMNEKQVRQMLAYAIPDLGYTRAYSPIAPTSWAYTDEVKHYDTDIKQASKLFESTKMSTSSAEITITTYSQYLDVAQKIVKSWQDLGLKVNIRTANTVNEPFQILLSAQDIPTDPDQYIYWHSTQTATNISGIANAKIDKLLEDGRIEQNTEKRTTIYIDFQKRLVEELPVVFLYYPTTYSITRLK